MDFFSKDISHLVFKADISNYRGRVSITKNMLIVLAELKGTKSVADVARTLKTNIATLRGMLNDLYQLNLIEKIDQSISTLDNNFIKHMEARLAELLGPIAGILIKDIIEKMGEEPTMFPSSRAEELVDLIAIKIYIEDERKLFQNEMKKKI